MSQTGNWSETEDARGGASRRSRLPGALPPGDLTDPPEAIRRNRHWLIALGALLILGGIAAAALPFAASIAVEALVGATMLAGGAVQLWQAVKAEGWRCRALSGLSGAVYIAGGVLILLNPFAGLVAITLVILAVFLVDGIARVVMGVRQRPERGWGWTVAGGALTAILSAGLTVFLPAISLSFLGFVAAVVLILEGWGWIFLGVAASRARGREEAGREA